jgi:hypothetical protein
MSFNFYTLITYTGYWPVKTYSMTKADNVVSLDQSIILHPVYYFWYYNRS